MRLVELIDRKIDNGFVKMLESQIIEIELTYKDNNDTEGCANIRCSAFTDGFRAWESSGGVFEIIDELVMNKFTVISCGKRSYDVRSGYATWFILSKQNES